MKENKCLSLINFWRIKRVNPIFLTMMFFGLFILKGYANLKPEQELIISGIVKSKDDGLPLAGVNIIVKGTNSGVVTDFDGAYSLSVSSEEAVLVFSSIGFVTKEITVGSQREINVELETDIGQLEEVVVVGYGTTKRATLTGSIDQVKAEAFEDLAVTSPGQALQGRTPGLVVTRTSSRPGSEGLSFTVRGASSTSGISPLIVIDGIPAIGTSSLNEMNPNDIESISVLKGGAASIYGSRAAGGVILVTTKKGKGKVKVEVGTIFRLGTIGIRPATPTAQQYAKVYLEAASNDLFPYWADWEEALPLLAEGYEGIFDNPRLGPLYLGNANIFDQMYGNSYSNQHNLSVSGSSETSNYRVSLGYDQNVGGLKTAYDGAEKYNIAVNYGMDISDRLKLNTNITYFKRQFSGVSGGLGVNAIGQDPPFFPAKNPYGQWYANFGVLGGSKNAIANTVDGGRINNKTEQLRFILSADYKINDDLSFNGSYSFTRDHQDYQKYVLNVPTYGWFGELARASVNLTPYIYEEQNNGTYENYKGTLNYKKSFGNHNLSATAVIEGELKTSNTLDARRDGFEDLGTYDLSLGPEDVLVTTNGGGGTWGFLGYVGRIDYDYKDKYILQLQGRRDGASRFAEGYKWSNYGSISGGWVLTKEDFLNENNVFSFLKIRGGYSEVGSTTGIGTFSYLQTVNLGGTAIFGDTPAIQGTATADGLFSNTTTWERLINKEIGVDFELFNNKVFGYVDLFIKENIGMLIKSDESDILGTSAPVTNLGNLETKGWEASVGFRDQIGDLDLTVSANMSDTRNKLIDYLGADTYQPGLNSIRQGDPLNSFYMYHTDGLFEDETAVQEYYDTYTSERQGIIPVNNSTVGLRPGDVRIVDTNGDGAITEEDVIFKGESAPHYVFGFNIDARYKNWDLTVFFQGVLDQTIHRTGYLAYPFARRWTNHTDRFLGKTWTVDNPDPNAFPRTSTQATRAAYNYAYTDFMLENVSYARLKSLILGYNIKGLKIGNTDIDNLRVYFSGNDLLEITDVNGWDPEANPNTNSSNASYPFMRTWALGVKISI